MNHWHTYLHSFQQWKKVLFSFLIDSATALFLFLLLFLFGTILKSKIDLIMQGRSVEEVKLQLLSGSLENAERITDTILSFAYTFIGGLIILIIISLLIYSLSRAYLWNYLINQKFNFHRHFRWNWLTLVMLIFLTLYSLIFLVVQFILNLFLATANTTVISIVTQLVSFFLLLLFCFYGFNASYHFVKSNQVWKSLGDAFHSFSSSFFLFILLPLGTAILVGLVSFYLRQAAVRFYWAELLISPALLILFLSWFRIYTLLVFHQGKDHETPLKKEA